MGNSYAKINPALIDAGIISEWSDYATVLGVYRTYLESFVNAQHTSNFRVGTLQNGAIAPFDRFALVCGRNPLSVKQNGSYLAAEVDYGFTTDCLTDAVSLDAALDAFFANAAAITPAGTSAANYRIPVDALPEGMEFSTEGTEADGAVIKNGNLYISLTEGSATALSYTLPASVDRAIFSLSPTALAFDGAAAAFRYAIAVNGTVVWPAGASAQPNNAWAEAASLTDMQNALSSLALEARGTDAVALYLARAEEEVALDLSLTLQADNYHSVRALSIESDGKSVFRGLYEFGSTVTLADLDLPASFAKNGVFINYATEVSELPASLEMNRDYHIADRVLGSYASISITSSFAINLYVKAENGADEAGVIIDGKKQAGTPMGNGLYRITLPVAPKDMPTTEISYQAYQTSDGRDTVNAARVTLRAFDLLSHYEASEDASTKLLASTIRYYSLAARDYFVNGQVTLSADAQTALREADTDILSMVSAYKDGTAYRPYPDGTNVNAFAFRIKGVSLKLDDRLAFAFRADRTSGATFGDTSLYLRVTDASGEVRYLSEGEPFDEAGLEMLYFVKNLPATEYGTDFCFTLVDANGEAQSATLTYSAHAYIARTFDTTNGDATTFHYLLRGIYALGEASVAYASYHVDYDKDYFSPVGDGGDTLSNDAFCLTEHPYDEADAIEKPAASFFDEIAFDGKVYRANGAVTLNGAADRSFGSGELTVLIFPDGVTLSASNDLRFENLVIVGDVTLASGDAYLFRNVQFTGKVTVDADVTNAVFDGCRLTSFENGGTDTVLMNSYMHFTRMGLHSNGTGLYVSGCRFEGTGTAIHSEASEATLRFNTILLETSSSCGILLDGDGETVNVLVAQNVITGSSESLSVSGMCNTSVVLNSLVLVRATNNKNLYVCDNAIGGKLMLENNNYLLADGNTYPADTKDHAARLIENSNTNGDDITDVDARAEVGVNEDLLPHVDKELFTYMERRDTVKEPGATEGSVYDYIEKHAKTSSYVVVAPGAYTTDRRLLLDATQSNTTIYAYGVFVEAVEYTDRNYSDGQIRVDSTENIAFKGITIGFAQPSVGQVYVLNKTTTYDWDSLSYQYTATVVAGAGFWNEFANSGSPFMSKTDVGLQRAGTFYGLGDCYVTSVAKNEDGTMTLTLPQATYDALVKGDIMTCRLSSSGAVVTTYKSKDILFKDVTQYGFGNGFAFYEYQNTGKVTYYRVTDTNKNGRIIDQETYDWYRALENQYGVDLEISTDTLSDGTTVYRGAPAHSSSLDGVHNNSSLCGSEVISSLFEGLCDDMTNQKSTHARLSDYIDNGDGTVTLIYKGNISNHSYVSYVQPDSIYGGYCAPFLAGERVFIYTADGQLVCDGIALADQNTYYDTISSTFDDSTYRNKGTLGMTIRRCAVTVDADTFHPEVLEGIDLTDDSYASDNKVLVDNLSRASYGFHLDNVLVQNSERSGIRAKASGGVVEHCTFRNVAKTATSMVYEIYWGESGTVSDYTFRNNLIDNTGYAQLGAPKINASADDYRYTPICIIGLGGYTIDEEHMLFKNVVIEGNKFVNRYLGYYNAAIFARAACNLTIRNNDFGTAADENGSTKYAGVLYLDRALNVELSGNTYSPYVQGNYTMYVQGSQYKNIYGTDVTVDGVPQIADQA